MLHDGSGCWIPGWLTLDDQSEMMMVGRARARMTGRRSGPGQGKALCVAPHRNSSSVHFCADDHTE